MNTLNLSIAIGIMMVITFSQKYVPFLVLSQLSNNQAIRYLGKMLPASIMLILSLYTLQESADLGKIQFIASFIASLGTVILHLKFRQALLSIFGGVLIYGIIKLIL